MTFHMNINMKNKGSAVKLQRTNKGQWTITIPSTIAAALDMKEHESMKWIIEGNNLILRRKKL